MSEIDKDQLIEELQTTLRVVNKENQTMKQQLVQVNERLEKFIVQVQKELRTAQAIQKILVPTEFPNIPGFEFSTKFLASPTAGGDYFDIFEQQDRFRFGVVLASSSGYAISALLMSVLLKFSVELRRRQGLNPAEVLEVLQREMSESMEDDDQANVFYAAIDRRNYELSYRVAGGVIAYHYDHTDNKIKKLDFGEPLRKEATNKNAFHTLSLNPRDRLVVCSPGVFEAQNLDGQVFGEERLSRAILQAARKSIHELRNEVVYQAERFSEGVERSKDWTVVALEVKDRVIKLAQS